MMRRTLVAALATLILVLLGGDTLAQQAEALPRESSAMVAAPASLRFRRVYAPAERVQDWPRGTARYVPVDGPEFERLLKAAEEQAGDHPAPAALARAEYTAQFDGIDGLQGTFAWEIERTGSSASAVDLAPLNLALEKTRWSDSPQPVELGMGENGAATLIANRAGTVTGTWSLRGRPDSDGQLAFRFELPRATFSTLLLTVPPGVVPTVGSGLASFVEEQTERHVYRLLLGGADRVTLRLPRESAPGTNQPKVLLRETALYNLSPRGIDLAAVWKLDVHATPVRQLEIVLDPGLQLVAARLGDSDIPFRELARDGGAPSRVTLDLPDALAGSDRPLRLSAIGALPSGLAPLPRIRATNCTWQEGTCTVSVQEPLVVRRLTTRDCRQTKYSLLPEPNRGESFEIQWFSEASAVECDLARDQARAIVSTGLRLKLGDDLGEAELVALARGVRGRCSSLVADVGPEWLIDAVDTEPRDALDRWHVDTQSETPQLRIRLARPLGIDTPVRLIIRAHRAASKEAPDWSSNELDVLRFRNVDFDEQWLTLTPAAGRTLTTTSVENLPVAVDAPAPDWEKFFLEAPKHAVYRFDPGVSQFTAKVTAERPSYAAKIVLTATIDATSVNESCSLRCQPVDDPVSSVVVRFSESRPEPPRFQLQGERQTALVAHRVVDDESGTQAASSDGEAWEVSLVHPQKSAFEIKVERKTQFADRIALGLVQLPDAVSQQAQLVVDAAADVEISVEAAGLTSLPVADDPIVPTTRGVYRYTPINSIDKNSSDRKSAEKILIARQRGSLISATAASVWHRRTESHYDGAGNSWHSATFQLRNAGQSVVQLEVPDGCEITRLWLDGQLYQRSDRGRQASVELPPDERSVTLAVEYRGPGMPRLGSSPLTAPLAAIDVPIFSSDWLLWLPPGFAITGVDGGYAEPAATGLSWSERLFGPLGRAISTAPFAPLSLSGWRGLAARAEGKDESGAFAARFDELARSLVVEATDWGSLLSAAAELAEETGTELRVDAAALAAAGIGPRSRVLPVQQDFATQPVRGLLASANLTFVHLPDAVLLTSRVVAAIKHDQLRLGDGEHAGTLESATLRSAEDEHYPTATIWAKQGQQPDGSRDARYLAGDLGTANPFLIHADAQSPPVAQISYAARHNAARAAACVLMLAVCLFFSRRMTVLTALLAIAAATALVLPERFAPLATGSLWGIALAIVWQWLAAPPRPAGREPSSRVSKSTARRLATALPLLLAILSLAGIGLLTSRATGQQDNKPVPRDEGADDVYRVFIPVDDQERPTNDKYQVPERLYDELQRFALRSSGANTGWLIRSARYQLALARDGLNEGYVATDVRAQYDVLALSSDVLFRLPMLGVRPGLVAVREGREIELEWDIDEDGFYCHFDEPGMYQLNLSLRAQRGEAAAGSLDMSIPAVPHATAVVQLPVNLSSVEVTSALGSSSVSNDGRTLTAELGATDRLMVRWARSRQPRSENIAGEAEAWLWLQVQPASVILHARLEITGLQAPLTELWLSVDPRLRALPVVDRTGTVASVQPLADDPRTVRVELARPITDHASVPVSFLLVGSSGVGQLTLPRIEPQGLHVGKRVLAVSVEPALDFSVPEADPKSVMNVGEFLTHWGGAPAPPLSVVQLGADEPWTLSTRPRNPTVPARQTLTLSIGPRRELVRFVADIAGGDVPAQASTYTLQHRVRAPVDLEVEKLTLVQDGIDRVSRWTRDDSGLITIFFSGPVTGRQKLTLEGWLPTPLEGNWPLPRIDLDSVNQRETTISLLRQPSVQVAVNEPRGLVEAIRPRADESPLPGQIIASLVAGQADYSATLQISPNHPQVRATLLATISRDSAGARGTLDYHAVVEEGFVDTISINLPAAWTGPFDVAPAAPWEIVTSPQGARRLIIRPKTPAAGDVQFTLRGPLELVNDRPLAMPTLSADVEGETFAMLPANWGAERLRWNTRGMQPDRLPESLARENPAGGAQVFRVIEADAAALPTIAPVTAGSEQPTAKVRWFCSASGASHGVATFVVHEAAESSYSLHLPDGAKLLELRVGGRLLTPVFVNNSCVIKLAPLDERQVIEVIFASESLGDARASTVELAAPFLPGLDFAETAWVVANATCRGPASILEDADMPRLTAVHRVMPSVMDAGAIGADSTATQFDFAGNVPTIRVQFVAPDRTILLGRWGVAMLLVAAGIAFARMPMGRIGKPLTPVLVIAGVAAGFMAIVWLTPAWIGVVLALATVAAGYRQTLAKALLARAETASGDLPA
jgi:hypothetical protein